MIKRFFRREGHSEIGPSNPDRLMFRPAPNVKASANAEGMVFIHHGTGTVFSANRVGAMIWKGATEGRSLEEVTASISSEFDIPSQIVRQDAVAYLAQLQAEGLLIPNAK